ncbi:MAG: hypothetical protein ACI351_01690 [Candidatus Avelusimicrobium sp.]|uniref:hypothetical protein n=1 Tax=Candidatus Avelusimicrobium sp. TaxID=3048833 RepID=UPI003F03B485
MANEVYSARHWAAKAQQAASQAVSTVKMPITVLTVSSGNISLVPDAVYRLSLNEATVFTLQAPEDISVHHQIKLFMEVTGTPTINWGTVNFFNETAPDIAEGKYIVYYDYDPNLSEWVCGAMRAGVSQ